MLRRVAVGLICVVVAGCGQGGGVAPGPDQPKPDAEAFRAAQLQQLAQAPAPEGVSPALWRQLKDALSKMLSQSGKVALAAPVSDASAARLAYDGGTQLSWGYACQGDYDQNSQVNISDLARLGQHYGATTGGGPFPPDSIESVVDGDGNGEINIADVTPIGQNFGRRAAGFNVYQSTDQADLPAANDGPNGAGAQTLGAVALADAVGDAATQRLQFSFNVPAPPANGLFWVRPNDAADGSGAHGTPSIAAGPERVSQPGGVQLPLSSGGPRSALPLQLELGHSRALLGG